MDDLRLGRARGRLAASFRFGGSLVGTLLVIAVSGCGGSVATPSPMATITAGPSIPTASPSPEPGSPTIVAALGQGRFTATGSMSVARSGHAAVLLKNGRVLIVAGSGDGTAEVYDPLAGVFSQTGAMTVVRMRGATANLLSDGRVLITGGVEKSPAESPIAAAELYDPKTGAFARTGSMAHARSGHTATVLSDGRVLVVGGYDGSGSHLASAELYDPTTGRFSPTGPTIQASIGHTATLMQDGRVLIVGGSGTGAKNDATPTSAQLYDPETGKFAATGSMATPRWSGHTATLLKDGRVLVEGGSGSSVQEVPLASAELYDPKTGQFGKTDSMAVARDTQGAAPLPDGRILIVGGDGRSAELYDPETGKFAATGSTLVASSGPTATPLSDGRVLVVGGWDGVSVQQGSTSAEIYQP